MRLGLILSRLHQCLLIGATLALSWVGMQAAHELGHVAGAWCSGGRIARVVLHPLRISRTDLAWNPQPLLVAWAGPAIGVLLPLAMWGGVLFARCPWHFLFRFFAGFCLVANGAYIGAGSFGRIGDAGDLLGHGSEPWQLWLFGAATVAVGILVWHGLGASFGFGPAAGRVSVQAAWSCAAVLAVVVLVELLLSR